MSEPEKPPVAHGDRREDVWIEDDPRQLSKVRHTWPVTRLPPDEHSEATREGAAVDPCVTDAAVVPDEPSVWEAVEDDD